MSHLKEERKRWIRTEIEVGRGREKEGSHIILLDVHSDPRVERAKKNPETEKRKKARSSATDKVKYRRRGSHSR